jgi:hypothetical protein
MRATTQITRLCTRDGSVGLDVATAPNEADISQRFASSAEYRARHKKQRDSDTKRRLRIVLGGQVAGCPPAMRRAATALKSPSCRGVRR